MVGIQRVVGNEYILYYWWSSLGNYNLMKSLSMLVHALWSGTSGGYQVALNALMVRV